MSTNIENERLNKCIQALIKLIEDVGLKNFNESDLIRLENFKEMIYEYNEKKREGKNKDS